MGYYDDLDREIDQEMGWVRHLKNGEARRQQATSTGESLRHLIRRIRFPRPLWNVIKFVARSLRRFLLFPLITPLSYSKSLNVDGDMMLVKRPWQWRIFDAILTRLLITPIILAIFLISIVYASTHPQRVQANASPESVGIYFKRVRLITVDGQGLSAWYIPPITAEEMFFNPEASLLQKWPAVVVCHGLGAAQDQYLPMAQDLHAAGFAVLMVDLRGQGESDPAAVTYGLRERLDVLAGVKFLRELPNVDAGKVCVIGHDIAAMAVLQAAALDSSIAAVVADGIWPRFEDRARLIFSRPDKNGEVLPTAWLAPLYTTAFEIAIRDRFGQLDPEALVRSIHTQPVLFVARQGPQYAPVQDVMTLATSVGARHEVVIAAENPGGRIVEQRARDFLIQATQWKGPKARGMETIEKFLEKRVK